VVCFCRFLSGGDSVSLSVGDVSGMVVVDLVLNFIFLVFFVFVFL